MGDTPCDVSFCRRKAAMTNPEVGEDHKAKDERESGWRGNIKVILNIVG